MDQHILPFTIDVEMRMYHNKSFPLGAIKANIDNYNIWLCNKLITCVWRNGCVLDSVDNDIWGTRDGLTFSQDMWVSPQIFLASGFDLIKFIKYMLKNDNYITGGYDEYYIPNKKAFDNFHFSHDYILFGYDDNQRIFKSAAYIKDRTYDYYDISYDDYYNAVTKNQINKTGLNFKKINTRYEPKINIELIISDLENYCCINNSVSDSNTDIYGIKAFISFSNYILTCEENLDLRFSRGYKEHHFIMFKRFQILKDLNYIKDEQLVRDYEKIYLKTEITHNLFIKYNLTMEKVLLEKISEIILSLVPIESELIKRIIENIKY